jgi:hypothetical protein
MITLSTHISHTLQPLNVNCFKPFKLTFKKEKDNNMVWSNQNEPNKTTLVRWVDKTLDQLLSKEK